MDTSARIRPTTRVVRVYASDNQWGDVRQTDPIGSPVTVAGFPSASEALTGWVGPVPEWLAAARTRRMAIGGAMLRGTLGGESLAFDALFDEELASREADQSLRNANWYVTIAVGGDTVDIAAGPSNRVWIDVSDGWRIAEELRGRQETPLDLAAAYLSPTLGGEFFERIVLKDTVVFSLKGYDDLSLPEFSGGGKATLKKGIENFPGDQLRTRIAAIASKPLVGHRWLARSAHWWMQARLADDEWKRFLWSFLALEVLTHKVAGQRYAAIRAQLRVTSVQTLAGNSSALSAITPTDPSRLTLVGEFAVVALALSPDTADDDVQEFKRAKVARDRLAHGDIRDAAELPTGATLGLLDRYMRLAIEEHLGS